MERLVLTPEEYISAVTSQIKGKREKRAVEAELSAHLSEKREYYESLGYDEIAAAQRAVEDMGEPDAAAAPFAGLYNRGVFSPLLMISIAFCAAFFILALVFDNEFAYGKFSPTYDTYPHTFAIISNFFNIRDFIADFASVLFIAGFALINIFSLKRREKLPPLICGATLLLYLTARVGTLLQPGYIDGDPPVIVDYYSICSAFEPAFYMLVTVFSKGFSGYIGSVFFDAIIPEASVLGYRIFGVVITVVLIGLSALVCVLLFRQELMRKTRGLLRIAKYSLRGFSLVFALYLAVFSACTVIALANQSEIKARNAEQRNQLIDFVLNTEVYSPISEVSGGYDFTERDYDYFWAEREISVVGDSQAKIYYDRQSGEIQGADYRSLYEQSITRAEFLKVYDNYETLTLDEFLSFGYYTKATEIINHGALEFVFVMKKDDLYNEYIFDFEDNGKLNDMRYINMTLDGEIQSMIPIDDYDWEEEE